ncbi:MAG: outer membrane lipoprotein carrier protein LolA [Hyphomicrobiales bacterium]|nr:outer membrane lipoprotein carrier protein LolA [Hyphomicrobiales bacterium]
MRKIFLNFFLGLLLTIVSTSMASSQTGKTEKQLTRDETVKEIAEHFVNVPTMAGEFIQFGPRGNQTGGKFFIQRPGKIRFVYQDPTPIKIISNGKTVAVNNRKLKTWNFYPLRKTPLSLVLGDKMAIDPQSVREVRRDEDLTTIVMGDEKIFGNSIITMMFDPRSFDLRQWVIRDAQGKETTVMIFNVEKNVEIPAAYFKINQLAIQRNQSEADR